MRAVVSLSCALLVLPLFGCQTIYKEVNATWPPKDTVQKQFDATTRAVADLAAMRSPNAFVTLKTTDWKPHLEALLLDQFPEIKSVDLASGRQELIAEVKFSGAFQLENGDKIQLAGTVKINLAASFNGSKVTLDPSFSQIVLTRASYRRVTIPKELVSWINKALNSFINNINGAIGTYGFDVRTDLFAQFTPDTVFDGSSNVQSPYGNPIKITVGMPTAALLVDVDGISLLAELVATSPERINSAIAKLNTKGIVAYDANDDDIQALRATCPEFLKFSDLPEAKAVVDACRQLPTKPLTALAAANATSSEFDKLFAAYGTQFSASVLGTTQSPIESFSASSASVQKTFLSSAVTLFTADAAFGASYLMPPQRLPFDETLTTSPHVDLDCGHTSVSSCPQFHCPDGNHCSYSCRSSRSCPSSCDWWRADCVAWKALCETIKAGEVAGCEVGRGVCLASCTAEFTAKTIACEAERLAKQAGCLLNQGWLDIWENKRIGNIKGSGSLENALGIVSIKATTKGPPLQVTPDFSQITLRGTVAAQADVHAKFTYTPLDLGHILCIAQWSGSISAHASAPQDEYELTGEITAEQNGDALNLWITSKPIGKTLKLNPAPVAALFEQNPQFAVICAPVAIAGLTVQIFGELKSLVTHKANDLNLLQDTFPFEIPSLHTPIVLQPIDLYFPTSTSSTLSPRLQLLPNWTGPNVTFRVKR